MTPLLRPLILASILLCAPATPVIAAADENPDRKQLDESDEERATDYYREARQLYEEGRFERAAELLDRAYQTDPNLVYRYNQILALQGAGEYREALELLETYDDQLREDDDFEDIDEIHAELQEAVPDDDQPRADDEPEDQSDLLAWSLVGTGGVSLAAGLVVGSGVLIDDTVERLEAAGREGVDAVYADQEHDRDEDLSRLRTHRWLSVGLLAGGVVLGATGTTLLWSRDDDPPRADRSVEVRPAVDIDFAGAIFEGRF